MSNISIPEEKTASVTDSNVALFNPQYLTAINNFAQVMASGVSTIPKHLQGNPADCMAIAMQAAQWQMNPFAVAQKTFTVGGVLGYEAQLVNAVISTRGPLVDRINYDWFGPWEKVIGKFDIRKSDKGEYRVPGWKMADEEGIGIHVWATLKGEMEPRKLTILLAQARTRNSTLWADDPRQQLAYLAVKRWARLYCPEVILGVYTIDELEQRSEREINPQQQPTRVSVSQLADGPASESTQRAAPPVAADDIASDIRTAIENASTTEQASTIRAQVEELKQKLGISAFTELKNKVVKRHRQITAATSISVALTECRTAEEFAAVEALVRRSERDLGADELERFQLALDDMRPEFQG
ncbi:RecT family recombinase [Serratia liquefaciens]|uniref:RecT family recombinase n=1 Tax=Serratia liquefaciens TaxID=614 RepID=UPI003818BECD